MSFLEFQVPTLIVYGTDSLIRLPELATPNSEKVVIVTDKKPHNSSIAQKVKRMIEGYAYGVIIYEMKRYNTQDLFEGVNITKHARADVVIGIGDSEVLSIAKVIAQFSTHEFQQEEVKSHRKLFMKKVRYIEIPTLQTICWGILPQTYITDDTDKTKKPYIDKESVAHSLIIDPALSEDVPLNDIIYSSLEAIAYSFDAYIGKKANPISDAFSLRAIEYLSVNLKRVAVETANTKIKGNLSMGSLLASLAIYGSSLGTCAATAMGLESQTDISQSVGAAVILPHVMEFNLTAAANKFIQIAAALGEKVTDISVIEAAIMAVEAMRRIMLDLHIPQRLSEYNIPQDRLEAAARVAGQYDFMTMIPRPASKNELVEIYSAAY